MHQFDVEARGLAFRRVAQFLHQSLGDLARPVQPLPQLRHALQVPPQRRTAYRSDAVELPQMGQDFIDRPAVLAQPPDLGRTASGS